MQNDQIFSSFLIDNQQKIDSIGKRLKDSPKGSLCVRIKNGKPYYTQVASTKGKQYQRGITKKPEIIEGLIKRQLLEAELDARNHQQELMRVIQKQWPEFDLQQEISSLKRKYPSITDAMISCALAEQESAWASEPFEQSDYRPEERRQINSHGLKVRSKSEVLITEKFYEHKIAFRYEQVIEIGKIKLNPDFTIRRSDGKIFIWEHEGLTNSQEYLNWQQRKAQLYASIGIVPWDNLIVTYDKPDGVIDLRIVEFEIINKLTV